MLRTNSKQARENVRGYIMANENIEEYAGIIPADFPTVAAAIYAEFRRVYDSNAIRRSYPEQEAFAEWAAGLPSILDTCYYYNRSARDDLAAILDETPEQAAKYTESDAERLLSCLIWREIKKEAESK